MAAREPLLAAPTGLDALRRAAADLILMSFPHGALIVFDDDLRYVAAGGRGLADVGLSPEMMEGNTLAMVFPPEVVDVVEPLYRAALRGEQSAIDIDYGGRTYHQRLAPLRDESGTVVAGLGFTEDITEALQERHSLVASQVRLREEQRRLEDAQTVGRVGSWEWDLASGVLTWSDAMLALYGLDPTEFDGDYATALDCVHPDDRVAVEEATQACLATGSSYAVRYRVHRLDDGEMRWFDARGQTLYDGPVPVRLAGAVADITEQVEAEQEAREAQSYYNAVLAASPDLTFVLDLASGKTTYASRAQGVLGLSADHIKSMPVRDRLALVHPEDRGCVQATEAAVAGLLDGEVVQTRYRGHHADGTWRWMSRRLTPFRRDGAGKVIQILGVTRDDTDAVRAEQRLTQAALQDPLTGLPNRALLIERLDAALARAQREGREVAVLFCDLDGFKRVNDSFGHSTGDALLVEMARRISGALRDGDTVARVGGDEFVLLLEPWNRAREDGSSGTSGSDRDEVVKLADRVATALRRSVVIHGVEHVVTASIGIAHTTDSSSGLSDALTADQMVQDADAAMYRAKSLGRDRVEVFRHTLRTDLVERGRVERLLREALRGESGRTTFAAAFQPVVDGTGRLRSFEALARLTDEDGVAVPPDVFIPIAEDTGQIRRVGSVMLDLACAQLSAWRRGHPDLADVTMAVNVSAHQAQQDSLEQEVHDALAAYALQPRDLTLELTETALLEAAHSTLDMLHRLRDEGIGIAIDDFGTGYASLRYLATLPLSAVKVDQSFTAGLPGDETSRKIINAVASLAADLDLTCVVEGVETDEQRAALPPGVHLQGWLLGRPAPGHELSRTLPWPGADV